MRRYALAGASSRSLGMYARPIDERYRENAEVVGIFDINKSRAAYVSSQSGDFPCLTTSTRCWSGPGPTA